MKALRKFCCRGHDQSFYSKTYFRHTGKVRYGDSVTICTECNRIRGNAVRRREREMLVAARVVRQ